MNRMFALILTIFLTGFCQCRSERALPGNFEGKQIIFGSGGGITGLYTKYYLLRNGDLFSEEGMNKSVVFNRKLPGQETAGIFSALNKMDFENIQFSHPGNITYFIEYKSANTAHRVAWGSFGHEVPAAIENLYRSLTNLTQ